MTRKATVLLLSILPVAATAATALAAKLTPADIAWIESCVAQRKGSKDAPARLRKYCTCMHEVVEDNQPFGITELERSYPPVHELCWDKYRLHPG